MIMANNWKNGIILKWHHSIKRVKHFLKWKILKNFKVYIMMKHLVFLVDYW